MATDLTKMTRVELEQLRGDIDKELRNAEARDRKEAKKAAEEAAAKFGFSLSELAGGAAKGRAKVSSPPKYANPKDASQTWTGKGRQPQWFKKAMEKGTDPKKLEI